MAAHTTEYTGCIEEFSGNVASWTSWYKRLQFYFVANDVKDVVKKRAHLPTLCGTETYETVYALLQPLDVCLNKPVKDNVRKYYCEWMEQGEQGLTPTGRLKRASLAQLARWIRDASRYSR